jgi:hypothetical protein
MVGVAMLTTRPSQRSQVLAARDHGDATFLLSGYWTSIEPRENRPYMNAKVLPPSRLTGRSLAAASVSAAAAERGEVRRALAPRRGGVAFPFHRMLEVGEKVIGIGGRPGGLDRLDEGGWGSWYVRDNSVQAGGNDPGP